MAEELRYTVRADGADKAAADLDKLADKAEKIEGKAVEAKVSADTSRAAEAIRRVDEDLRELSDKDRAAVLRLEAKQFEREIGRARKDLADLDGEEATARIGIIDNARANLDLIEAKLREIDGKTVDVKVEAEGIDQVDEKLGGIVQKAAALAGGAALFGAVNGAADLVANAGTLASALGASVEQTSALLASAQRVGIEYGDIFDIINQVNGVLQQSPELLKELGVAASTPLGRFQQAYDAIAAIEDPLRRNTLGAQAFGEEGVRQVAALKAAYGDFSAVLDAAPRGLTFTDEDVAKAREYKAALADVKGELLQIGADILPLISDGLNQANGFDPDKGLVGDKLPKSLQDLLGITARVDAQNRDTAVSLRELGDDADYGSRRLAGLGQQARLYTDVIDVQQRRQAAANRELQEVERSAADAEAALDGVGAAARRAERNFLAMESALERYGGAVKYARREEELFAEAIRERTRAVLDGTLGLLDIADAQQSLTDAVERWKTENHEATFAGELGLDPNKEGPEAEAALRDAARAAIRMAEIAAAGGRTPQEQASLAAGSLSATLAANPFLGGILGGTLAGLQQTAAMTPAALPGALTGPGGLRGAISGALGYSTIIYTGADPTAVRTALGGVAGTGGTWGVR